MKLRKHLAIAACLLALVATLGMATRSAWAAETPDPSVDCPLSMQKDGKSWNRQGSGWIRSVPGPNGSTDSFSMANYESTSPIQTKTYNCSLGEWGDPPA